MSTDPINEQVEADPRKPYKLYATIVITILTSIISSEAPLNIWAKVVISAVIAGLTVFVIPNPLRRRKGAPALRENEGTLF